MQEPASHPSSDWAKWTGLLFVAAIPWLVVHTALALGSDLPSEIALKDALFRARSRIDTVVVGDSRVLALDEAVFRAKGWAYFNMGLSGLSPYDTALQLDYALRRGTIRRVVLGASFESLSELTPFEHSRYYAATPFRDQPNTILIGVDPPRKGAPDPELGLRESIRPYLHLSDQATPRLHALLAQLRLKPLDVYFLANGNAAYSQVRQDISAGIYDFRRETDPLIYFERSDSEVALLRAAALSVHGANVYQRIKTTLESQGIPLIIFETGRTPEYQALIDRDPLLRRLQASWRAFFRGLMAPCVAFLEADELRYQSGDFFDAVHFIGKTETLVAEQLVATLATVEARCVSRPKHVMVR